MGGFGSGLWRKMTTATEPAPQPHMARPAWSYAMLSCHLLPTAVFLQTATFFTLLLDLEPAEQRLVDYGGKSNDVVSRRACGLCELLDHRFVVSSSGRKDVEVG